MKKLYAAVTKHGRIVHETVGTSEFQAWSNLRYELGWPCWEEVREKYRVVRVKIVIEEGKDSRGNKHNS